MLRAILRKGVAINMYEFRLMRRVIVFPENYW